MVDKVEYTFPDENKSEKEETKLENNELQIEVVDDTPEGDRGRKALDKEVKDPSDDELSEYSDKVKQRINELTHARHDERRQREAMEREKEEAFRLAQLALEENNKLKKQLHEGNTVQVTQYQQLAEIQLANAKSKMKAAHEAGDTDAFVEAQQEVAAAVLALDRAKSFKPTPLQSSAPSGNVPPNVPQHPPTTPQANPPDPKFQEWWGRNSWFGTDDEMTAFVLGTHRRLVKAGVDPKSDSYYEAIDKRMKEVFPDRFNVREDKGSKPPQSKPANIVAPVSRSSAPTKIVLTQSQVAVAKRLGVPLDIYARKVMELEQKQNG